MIFVKAGSIIPMGVDRQFVSEKKGDPITFVVYPGKDASFSVRAGAPTVQSGTVLVIKVPFQAGGQQYDLFIGREPVNTWVPAIAK